MTKSEFIRSVPDIIEHKTWGYAELEFLIDTKNNKGICYRHKNNISSGATYGISWLEVYQKLKTFLDDKDFISHPK